MIIHCFYPNCYQIDLGLVNCYLIEEKGLLTLIDTGYSKDKPRIYKAIAQLGFTPDAVKQIILTHLHPDHAGSAAALAEELNIPVYAHPLDAALIERGICSRVETRPAPGIANRILYYLITRFSPVKIKPVPNLILVSDGYIFPLLSGIQVIHTPGHSAGHISLLLMQEKVLIAMDVVVNNFALSWAPVYEDFALGRESVHKLSHYDFDIACLGHGAIVQPEASKKFGNLYRQFEK